MEKSNVREMVTEGIRVTTRAFFLPEESDVDADQYVFGYRITIRNEGDRWAKLLSRHWVIIDANGSRDDVEGEGVVGEQPELAPGESFTYTSYCPLGTPWGTMEGTYHMRREDGERFEVRIARFYLAMPVAAGETSS